MVQILESNHRQSVKGFQSFLWVNVEIRGEGGGGVAEDSVEMYGIFKMGHYGTNKEDVLCSESKTNPLLYRGWDRS
jgi:hypothetical protein